MPSRAVTRHIDPPIVQRLGKRLCSRKPDHIMEQLGISLNTWLKLLAGEPIRASVADRLLDRLGDIEEFN
ncbi:hypothetical protein C7E20_21290 [Sphingobium sp. AEW4]|nr:hypothetical protein C7E20_21290 [Sphingobium sp. AEW4]